MHSFWGPFFAVGLRCVLRWPTLGKPWSYVSYCKESVPPSPHFRNKILDQNLPLKSHFPVRSAVPLLLSQKLTLSEAKPTRSSFTHH